MGVRINSAHALCYKSAVLKSYLEKVNNYESSEKTIPPWHEIKSTIIVTSAHKVWTTMLYKVKWCTFRLASKPVPCKRNIFRLWRHILKANATIRTLWKSKEVIKYRVRIDLPGFKVKWHNADGINTVSLYPMVCETEWKCTRSCYFIK